MRALWNGTVIAEAEDTVVVEGNHYFPMSSVRRDVLRASSTRTICVWKGRASYFTLVDGDNQAEDAAWFYPRPFPWARAVAGRMAFGSAVEVRE